jgi:hypothetical protein
MNYYTTLEFILETFPNGTFTTADGFDAAVIGIEEYSLRLIYSSTKCIEILIDNGMELNDAIEHFEYNVKCAWIGEKTPIWCDDYYNIAEISKGESNE